MIALVAAANGQSTVDDSDLQSWNDLSITVALNKTVDLYIPVTFRFDHNIGTLHEGRIGAGVILKPVKNVAITPFYTFIRVRNSAGRFVNENRVTLRGVYRFPVKNFGLSHRSQYEYRIRPTGNLWRYRPSITIEKELPEKFVSGLKVYATEEPFFESTTNRFSRNRFSVGINKVLNKKLSLDIYYLYQGDNFAHPASVHVIGTAWRVKL
ncbi:MAG: DUF2490 domain-containing protein [Acidobacteria bacterium]|nr:DUF2490 domain-containing protein [Acidobacteriota bacterium]